MVVIIKTKIGPSTYEDVTNIALRGDHIRLTLKTKNHENFTAVYPTEDLVEVKILDF